MEKGVIVIRSNLLGAPAIGKEKMFPVRSNCLAIACHVTITVSLLNHICIWNIILCSLVSFLCPFFQTNQWVDILIISRGGTMMVRTSGKELAKAEATYENNDFKEYYVGGAPQDLRERCWSISILIIICFELDGSYVIENNLIFCSSPSEITSLCNHSRDAWRI